MLVARTDLLVSSCEKSCCSTHHFKHIMLKIILTYKKRELIVNIYIYNHRTRKIGKRK